VWLITGEIMENKSFGPYDVGRTVILGDGQSIMSEWDFQNDFTFDDFEELQHAIYLQNEVEDKLRAENEKLNKRVIAQQHAIHHLIEFERWLKVQPNEVLQTVLDK
jgi:hypothetical protein